MVRCPQASRKKLRYTTEFFASLYSRQRLRLNRAVLASLEDDLGWRNDVTVADGVLAALQAKNRHRRPDLYGAT